ncbi:NADH-quinone oxidoreductase subunit J [Actinomycetospora chibensis]|uniref:NADH-quinone oxidoreductase subunit J n=1 Tax=Actinomycetospora chibensis TaxID=663606 RepID=A0ABV9RL03_9PSEU|nr:NADH-quinone oxidoreductase subunit J [Actinomycetospora chibensis]MDD7924598.1 NADH-quinone oxidoreductase subunit J [Actinomycetospora chibensis]
MITLALFVVLAATAIVAGALVFRVDSMARATFLLLLSFLAVAGLVLMTGLQYLGVVIVLMMVIEMVVMAVFMIMYMMNPAGLMTMTMFHNTRGAVAIAATVFVALAAGALVVDWPVRGGVPAPDLTMALGESLMSGQMLTMMTLGVTLFATIVGSVVLATGRGRYDRLGDDLGAAESDDRDRGGVGR